MSLTKPEVKPSDYIATGIKSPSKGVAKKAAVKVAGQLNTGSLIWLLVKRHKVGLLALGNVVLVLNWVFPEWTELLKSVI